MPAKQNESLTKRARRKLYEFYDYTIRRPAGIVWLNLVRLAREVVIFYILPFKFTYLLIKTFGPTALKIAGNLLGKIFKPVIDTFKKAYNRLFGSYVNKKSYRIPAIENKFDQLDAQYVSHTNHHIFKDANSDDLLFAHICAGALSPTLSEDRSKDTSLAEYIDFLSVFKKYIHKINPSVHKMLEDNKDELDFIASTSDRFKTLREIQDHLIKHGEVTFSSGYFWSDNSQTDYSRSVDVESIIKIKVSGDGTALLYIYRNNHLTEVEDRQNNKVMLAKGWYNPNVSVIKLTSNNADEPITRETIAKSEIFRVLASGKGLAYIIDTNLKLLEYLAIYTKIDVHTRLTKSEIQEKTRYIEHLEDVNAGLRREAAQKDNAWQTTANRLRDDGEDFPQTEIDRHTQEMHKIKVKVDSNTLTINAHRQDIEVLNEQLLELVEEKKPYLSKVNAIGKNAGIKPERLAEALRLLQEQGVVPNIASLGLNFEHSFDGLVEASLVDFKTDYVDPSDLGEPFALTKSNKTSNYNWKLLSDWFKNKILAKEPSKKAAHNNMMLLKIELRLFALDEYFDIFDPSATNAAQKHTLLRHACANIARLLLKYESALIDSGEQISANDQNLLTFGKDRIAEISAYLEGNLPELSAKTKPAKNRRYNIESPEIFTPELLIRELGQGSDIKDDSFEHLAQQPHYNAELEYLGFDHLLGFCENSKIPVAERLLTLENFINSLDLDKVNLPLAAADQYQKMHMMSLLNSLSNTHAVLCSQVTTNKLRLESNLCSNTFSYLITQQARDVFDLAKFLEYYKKNNSFKLVYDEKKLELGEQYERGILDHAPTDQEIQNAALEVFSAKASQSFVEKVLGIDSLIETLNIKQFSTNPVFMRRKKHMANNASFIARAVAVKALEIFQSNPPKKQDLVPSALDIMDSNPADISGLKWPSYFERVLGGEAAEICRMFDLSLGKNLFFRLGDEVMAWQAIKAAQRTAEAFCQDEFKLEKFGLKLGRNDIYEYIGFPFPIPVCDCTNPLFRRLNPVHAAWFDYQDTLRRAFNPPAYPTDNIVGNVLYTLRTTVLTVVGIAVNAAYAIPLHTYLILTGVSYFQFNLSSSIKKELYARENDLLTNQPEEYSGLYDDTYLKTRDSLDHDCKALQGIKGLPEAEWYQKKVKVNHIGINKVTLNEFTDIRDNDVQKINHLYNTRAYNPDRTAEFMALYHASPTSVLGSIYEVILKHEKDLRYSTFQDMIYANLFHGDTISTQLTSRNPAPIILLFEHMLTRVKELSPDLKNAQICNFYLKVCADLALYLQNLERDQRVKVQNSVLNPQNIVKIKELNQNLIIANSGSLDLAENYAISAALLFHEFKVRNNTGYVADDFSRVFEHLLRIHTATHNVNDHGYSMWNDEVRLQEFIIANQAQILDIFKDKNASKDFVRKIFSNVTGVEPDRITQIIDTYPKIVVTLSDGIVYILNLKTGSMFTKNTIRSQCPNEIFTRPEYQNFFGSKVYYGDLGSEGKRFVFSPTEDPKATYELNLTRNTSKEEILVIKRKFTLNAATSSYILVENDALKDQIPETISENKDHELWFDNETKTILVYSKTAKAIKYVVKNNETVELATGRKLVCVKKNLNHVHIVALSKIEPIKHIELWCDTSDAEHPQFAYNLPRLNLQFIVDAEGDLISADDHAYRVKLDSSADLIYDFENYLVLEPKNSHERAKLDNKVLIAKYDATPTTFNVNMEQFRDRIGTYKYNHRTYLCEQTYTNDADFKTAELAVNKEFVQQQHPYNTFVNPKGTNSLSAETAEGSFQLAQILFNQNDLRGCMAALRAGTSRTESTLSEFYWLNLILISNINTPNATGIKAFVAALINEKYYDILKTNSTVALADDENGEVQENINPIQAMLNLQILAVIKDYYLQINNIEVANDKTDFVLDLKRQSLLLANVNKPTLGCHSALVSKGLNTNQIEQDLLFAKIMRLYIHSFYQDTESAATAIQQTPQRNFPQNIIRFLGRMANAAGIALPGLGDPALAANIEANVIFGLMREGNIAELFDFIYQAVRNLDIDQLRNIWRNMDDNARLQLIGLNGFVNIQEIHELLGLNHQDTIEVTLEKIINNGFEALQEITTKPSAVRAIRRKKIEHGTKLNISNDLLTYDYSNHDFISAFIDQIGINVDNIKYVKATPTPRQTMDYKQRFDADYAEDVVEGAKRNAEITNKQQLFMQVIPGKTNEIIASSTTQLAMIDTAIAVLSDTIIADANRLPEGTLHAELALQGKLANKLDMRKILSLFLHNSIELYKKETFLTTPQQIATLHEKVFQYLKAVSYKQFLERVKSKAEQIVGTSVDRQEPLIHELGLLLTSKRAYVPAYNPNLLLFEVLDNKLLREKQVVFYKSLLQKEASDKYRNIIMQMIMGDGKTTAVLPLVAQMQADGESLSMLMVPRELLVTNRRDLDTTLGTVFGQEIFVFEFDRTTPVDKDYFINLHKKLTAIIRERHCLITTPEAMQSFYLRFIEITAKAVEQMELPPEYADFEAIIKLLRSKGQLIADEADETIAKVRKETNYTLGEGKELSELYPDLPHDMVELFNQLSTYQVPGFALLHEYISGAKIFVSENSRKDYVAKLAYALMQDQNDSIVHDIFREDGKVIRSGRSLVDYLINENASTPIDVEQLSDPAKERIASVRAIFSYFLAPCLAKHVNEQYGFRHDPKSWQNSHRAVPYLSANTPSPKSEYQNVFQTAALTIFTMFTQPLEKSLFEESIKYMLSRRVEIMEYLSASTDPRDPSRIELEHINCVLRLITNNQQIAHIDPDKVGEYYEMTNDAGVANKDNSQLKTLLLKNFILPGIKIDTRKINATVFTIINLFRSVRGITGTPFNVNNVTMAGLMQNSNDSTIGVDGQTVQNIIKNTSSFRFTDLESANQSIVNLFEGIDIEKQNIHALIDIGAFCKGRSNEAVAREICEILKVRRPKIKQVLYFNELDILCAMSVDEPHTITEVGSTKPENIRRMTRTESPDECFTFYGQKHSRGVDIEQPKKAGAIVTGSERNILTAVLQGTMRMRGLPKKQKLHFVIPNDLKAIVESLAKNAAANPDISNPEVLVEAFIRFTKNNQIEELAEDHLLAARNQIIALLIEEAFSMLLNALPEQKILIAKEFNWLFESKNVTGIFQQYGRKSEEQDLKQHLEQFSRKLLQRFYDSSRNLNISNYVEQQHKLSASTNTVIGNAVKICKTKINVAADGAGDSANTQIERQQEQEKIKEKEIEIHTEDHPLPLNDAAVHDGVEYDQLFSYRYDLNSLHDYVTPLGRNLLNGSLYSNNLYLSYDSARVQKRYYSSDGINKIKFRKPIQHILYVRDKASNKQIYIALTAGLDTDEAMLFYSDQENKLRFEAEIFTLHGGLEYSNQTSDFRSPDQLMQKHSEAIAGYSLLNPDIDLLKWSDVLLDKSNNTAETARLMAHNKSMNKQALPLVIQFRQSLRSRNSQVGVAAASHRDQQYERPGIWPHGKKLRV